MQNSLNIVRTDWIVPLERKASKMVKKVAATANSSLLSYLTVPNEKKMSNQVRRLVDSQPLDSSVLVIKVRRQLKRMLPLHSQRSLYGIRPEQALEDKP